jgi:hypothetical protein
VQDRAATLTLRIAYPRIALVRVELTFRDERSGATSPAAQAHTVHPPAPAFFEYFCPYADCDGRFDLGWAASQAMNGPASTVEGTLECGGTRSRDGLTRQPCGLHLSYRLSTLRNTADSTE